MSDFLKWEPCSGADDEGDYTPSDLCVQLWRVLLCRSQFGELYGYAEQTRDGWLLDLGGARPIRVKRHYPAPPAAWINELAEFWGIALPEGPSTEVTP